MASGRLATTVFSVLLVLVAVGAVLSTVALVHTIQEVSTAMPAQATLLEQTQLLHVLRERKGRQSRNYLLTGDPRFLDELREVREDFAASRRRLAALMDDPRASELLSELARADDAHTEVLEPFLRRRQAGESAAVLGPELDAAVGAYRKRLDGALSAFDHHATHGVMEARGRVLAESHRSVLLLLVLVPSTLGVGLVLVTLALRTSRLLRASEIALARQLARVQEVNRDLDAFAGRVAHDFRSMLQPLSLIAGTLRRGEMAGERAEQVADRLTNLARRADRELEALLAFARGGLAADPKASAPLGVAVEQVLDDLAHVASAADLEISRDVQNVAVAVPPGLLQAVVFNLLGNAIKFVSGRPRRLVRVRGGQENGLCVLEVEDTGPGIAPEAQAHVFDPFYRAPGANTDGTGIGLAIVQRIVQAHGGEVTLRSVVGEGTTFRVQLPLAQGAQPGS